MKVAQPIFGTLVRAYTDMWRIS